MIVMLFLACQSDIEDNYVQPVSSLFEDEVGWYGSLSFSSDINLPNFLHEHLARWLYEIIL